ncbi:ATP-dependent DNA helicase RecG [Pseudoclavibacter endophyticus]|nr:ATP-dependent DNA helicase RecG [Pseudoclavibacter endophyticus]
MGAANAKALDRDFGIRRVDDLLHHYPRRYATRGQLTAIAETPIGEHVTLVAEVRSVQERKMRQRSGSITEVTIFDGRATATLTFFNQPWRVRDLRPGDRGTFSGKATLYRGGIQLAHPDFELFEEEDQQVGIAGETDVERWASELLPIYPASAAMPSWRIAQLIAEALTALGPLPDPVPEFVRAEAASMGYDAALRAMHAPATMSQVSTARRALRLTEAFVLQTALLQQRRAARAVASSPRTTGQGSLLARFDAALSFELTGDQRAVGDEIARELGDTAPMQRLVQGEVGSGKTVVAVRAMLQVADAAGQSALLAPTEVLATQHVRSIAAQLGPELMGEVQPTLLTGGMPQSERRRALLRIASGDARIVVGTHALLGDAVSFFDLGLVVVDEQHRFGVEQRERLRAKSDAPPHLLVLTATPIPRTVAMTVFGDLDVSTIAELPGGRAGITTHVVPAGERPGWLDRAWARTGEELGRGRQAFIVCPAIEVGDDGTEPLGDEDEGDAAGASALPVSVEAVAALARERPELAGRTVAELHGRMPSDEKDAIMRRFAEGGIDVLVATTVIEVGVNVPNASVMMVMGAERFGVSQLHQLRGRVGRGEHAGLCLLVTEAEAESTGRERVEAVASTLDGFELAQRDLELRREGDVLGSAQSGATSSLRLLRVARDGDLIDLARSAAGEVLEADPALESVEHEPLLAALARIRDEQRAFLEKS